MKFFSYALAMAFLTVTFLPTASAACEANGLPETDDCVALVEAEANGALALLGIVWGVDVETVALKACHPLLHGIGATIRARLDDAEPATEAGAPGGTEDLRDVTYLRDTCQSNVRWYL